MISGEPRRKRGRPPKVVGAVSAKDRKAAQRQREDARREEHPDRVVVESGLLWFETWVHAVSWFTEPDGSKRKVVTEGYRRFGQAGSNTPYGLVSKLPKEYQGSATKVLESMGLLPKRTKELRHRALPKPSGPSLVPDSKVSDEELDEMGARAADYADLTVRERIKEIDRQAGATSTKGEGAGHSTYEPPRTVAATVNDAAHALRRSGTEIAIASATTENEEERFRLWWEAYLLPYGGGAPIPAKIVRVSADEERAAKERLAEHVNEECARCGTSHLAVNESTLTLGCPACQEIRYVSLPKGILSVGGPPRKLTPEEEEEAAWASHQSREE